MLNTTARTLIIYLALVFVISTTTLWIRTNPATTSISSNQIPVLLPLTATVTSPGSNMSLPARPATFGPSLPPHDRDNSTNGFSGNLKLVHSLGCDLNGDYEDLTDHIALVQRGGCGFYEKILVLQEWGATAVIVGDNARHRGLVTMFTKDEIDLAQIPSVFVSYDSYQTLKTVDNVVLYAGSESSPIADTMIFLLVSPLCSLSLIYGLLLFHRRYKIMKERPPKSFVESLPTRIWVKRQPQQPQIANSPTNHHNHKPEKIWVSSGECIICLEDYVPGVSKVMRLPCDHEFHADCISKWLISRRKTCPICKKSVMETETTPLIRSGTGHSESPNH